MPPPRRHLEPLPEEIPEGGVNLRDTKYVLLQLLGKGAHGYAYLVRNPDLQRHEVMKILSDKVFELKYELVEEIIYRFKFEAQTLASIRNENVVHVNDIGLLPDGRPYFTMDYSAGVPLTHRLRQGQPLPLREALGYAIKMADGLAACHAKGVIHRDFKPGNVLVGDNGAVTIIDFGIAKKAQEHGEVHGGWTQAGAMLGTPAYMAPEQALGISDAVGPHTDVYALGTVIFVMLTGRLVFEGNTHDQIYHKLNTPVPSLLSAGANVPPELDRLVSRMLAKDVSNRIQTASEVRSELLRIQKLLPSEFRVSVNEDAGFDAPTMDARYDTAVRAAATDGFDPTRGSGPPAYHDPSTIDAPRRASSSSDHATVDARPSPRFGQQPASAEATTARASRGRPPLWVGALLGIAVFGGGIAILIGVLINRAPAETPSPKPSTVLTSTAAPSSPPTTESAVPEATATQKPDAIETASPPPTVVKPTPTGKQLPPTKASAAESSPTSKATAPPPATTTTPPTATTPPTPTTTAPPKPTKGVLDDPF
jgi:serine/threonine protein kinase